MQRFLRWLLLAGAVLIPAGCIQPGPAASGRTAMAGPDPVGRSVAESVMPGEQAAGGETAAIPHGIVEPVAGWRQLP